MRTLWFCEQDPYCQRVLAKHWPGVPCYPDVRALVADAGGSGRRQELRGAHGDEGADARRAEAHADLADGRDEGNGAGPVLPVPVPYVDVLCGGFPCQDISLAGKGAGIEGQRSGLWREFARLIGELRPRYVVVENVPALASRGLDRVLADLAACGFDAEWDHLPASAFGAPHRRDRLWLVAYPNGEGLQGPWPERELAGHSGKVQATGGDWWFSEPDVGRVAHGVPNRVDRLRALGNSLVPQIAQWIGERILAYEASIVSYEQATNEETPAP